VITKKIGVSVATVLATGGIGLTGLTSAASSSQRPPSCPKYCPAIHKPVKCKMSNGKVYRFRNYCEATRFACRNHLRIIICRPTY